ncbi:NAD(P)/FAD-dependent oxidoreductase [Tepidiforma sp.]|uniref:phytoene desaturase family protein n=1 Tax=Tepidiforma sp. TaxID=2682230 RepID=UPI002ADD7E97|nr:NAD(P)/FAD-dependent oxidoreductase [Tepidiforma sp.]
MTYPESDLDIAVIGSGFGGLAAAALSARARARVAVFERHTRPGGCAGDFALEGFWFPAGATVVTGLEQGGILRQLLDAIDVEVPSSPLDPSIVFHLPGRTVRYLADQAAWREEFAARFPGAAPGYQRFWDWAECAGGTVYRIGASLPSFPLERIADVRRSLRAVRPEVIRVLPDMFATVGQVKRRLGATGDPAADALIDALLLDATGCTASACSAVQGAIALDLYRHGCQWVDGGTGRIAMALVRAIRRHGGRVEFGRGVARLGREGRAWRLWLDGGGSVSARTVVANLPPGGLDLLLGRPPRLPRPGSAWGAFVLHLGIDAAGIEPLHPFHQVVLDPADIDRPGANMLVSIYPGRGQRADRWSISVSTHVEPALFQVPPVRAACTRRALEQRLLSAVRAVIPDVDDRVLLLRSATPATYQRYTGRPGGFVGGLRQVPSVVALRAPGRRYGPGLVLAGDHTFPGQGTVGTALSGMNAARDVLEYLGKEPPL